MRVGELVKLNREDVNFNERECIVFGKGNKERMVYFNARTKSIYNNTCLQGEIATRHFLFHLLSHMQDLEYQALKVDYVNRKKL